MRPKLKNFAVKFRRILEVFSVQALWKTLGACYRFSHLKMKLYAVEFRRISEVFAERALWKKFWAHFHDLCVQKRSCLPWSWDPLWKLSACEVYQKSSGRTFTIYASKNETVCREVQTHCGSSPPTRFIEKVLGTISRFMRPKTKLFAVKFRRILEVLCLQVLIKKLWAHFPDLCAKKRSCLPWNSDAIWKFSACKF